ncbi:storkhead-box protein 1-like [Pollicipes pollicipes]|uniref:storkhead-box protein 1-like n=1 Tax=Pollicipes pollicipes TaxID=41117 RepID=UPI001884FBC4|nr:storkhead-box protein 1-like [Pollicipes pollicipes]
MSGIDQRHLLNKCLVIDLRRSPEKVTKGHRNGQKHGAEEDGFVVFKAWLHTNLETYWSPPLLSALRRLTLVGLLRPCMFLVTAPSGHLEVIRTAWSQRTLRAPPGYTVAMLGEAHGYHVTPVAPGHFTSLPEAICFVIQALNEDRPSGKVTLDDVCIHLRRHFPHLELPDRGLVFSTLGRLVRERKVYHTEHGYRIVTPGTYQRQLAAELERDAIRCGRSVSRLVQTDLADIILGGSDSDPVVHARPLQSETLAPSFGMGVFARRHSLKLSASQREEHFRRASSMRYPSCVLRPVSSRKTYT